MDDAPKFDSYHDILENAKGIKGMVAFQEWKRQLELQIKMRTAEVLKPTEGGVEGTYKKEYMSGETAGIMHAIAQWDLLIEFYKQEITAQQEGESNES